MCSEARYGPSAPFTRALIRHNSCPCWSLVRSPESSLLVDFKSRCYVLLWALPLKRRDARMLYGHIALAIGVFIEPFAFITQYNIHALSGKGCHFMICEENESYPPPPPPRLSPRRYFKGDCKSESY